MLLAKARRASARITSSQSLRRAVELAKGGGKMNNIIYIVGLVVVVLAVLAFLGLR